MKWVGWLGGVGGVWCVVCLRYISSGLWKKKEEKEDKIYLLAPEIPYFLFFLFSPKCTSLFSLSWL